MVHLQIFDTPGALRLAGVPVIIKCLIQVYLKQKSSKCANLLKQSALRAAVDRRAAFTATRLYPATKSQANAG